MFSLVFFSFARLRRAFFALVLPALAAMCPAADVTPATSQDQVRLRPADALNEAAFEHYYNLDYDAAIQDFQKIVERHRTIHSL